MPKLIKFHQAHANAAGYNLPDVFINPEHVSFVSRDPEGGKSTVIGIASGQTVSLRDDIESVLTALRNA